MRRHRRCGCDCRDDQCAHEPEQDTPVCCSECPDYKSPCWYVAHFGCDIRYNDVCIARYSDILKPICDFPDEECEWRGLGFGHACSGDLFVWSFVTNSNNGIYFTTNGCTWNDTSAETAIGTPIMLPNQNGLSSFGWGWRLKLQDGGARFYYGDIEYTVDEWDCHGKNSLTLQSGQEYMPPTVCITPFWGDNTMLRNPNAIPDGVGDWEQWLREDYWRCSCIAGCSGTSVWYTDTTIVGDAWFLRSSDCGDNFDCLPETPPILPDIDLYGPSSDGYTSGCYCAAIGPHRWILKDCDASLPCEYTDVLDRCTCCDDCCDCFNVAVNGDCSGTPVTSSGQACVGGRTGLSDPAGVSREYCFNVNDGYGSHEICLVFYCNGTEWKLDVYCDGVFDSEGTVGEHLCCPLRFTFTFSVSCLECSFCGCVGEDDCDCDPATCCDLEGSTFNVTVTPRAGCSCTTPVTFTINDSITPGVWMGNTTVCGDAFSISGLSCENGTWSILGGVPALGCGYSDDAISEVVCPDLLVNFVADCGACIFDIEVSN